MFATPLPQVQPVTSRFCDRLDRDLVEGIFRGRVYTTVLYLHSLGDSTKSSRRFELSLECFCLLPNVHSLISSTKHKANCTHLAFSHDST